MSGTVELHTLDYHAAGEPLRIVRSGIPSILGDTMTAKRRFMAENFDHLRRLLMLEPRGHADMYGAVITVPVNPGSDCGVLFLHNEGYSTMCGHGVIALATAAVDHGLFQRHERGTIRMDTPAGLVIARPELHGGKVVAVTFENVPAFVQGGGAVEAGGRTVRYEIAFGGAWYAYVDAGQIGLSLEAENAARLIALGRAIRQAVAGQAKLRHPGGDADLDFLYGVIFVEPGEQPGHSRNACIFADGELDRSPTGTGVSGRAALHFYKGEIGLGEELVIESIIGTSFRVCCTAETQVGDRPAVVTEVTGSAFQTGEHRFVLDERDPLPQGFFIR